MAYSRSRVDSPEEEKAFNVSPLRRSHPTQLSNVFNASGYEQLEHENDDGVPINEDAKSPPSRQDTVDSLGIFADQEARTVRIRRVSRENTSAPEVASPDSAQGLLDSPGSANGKSPGRPGGPAWAGPKTTGIYERLMSKKADAESASLTQSPEPFLYSPSPNTPIGIRNNSPSTDVEPGKEDYDAEAFSKRFSAPPSYCRTKKDMWKASRDTGMIVLAAYPLAVGGLLLFVSFLQPAIPQVGQRGGLDPSTAATIVSFIGKSVEVSFAGVFLFCLGQALSRRSVSRMTTGVTLSEMNMRNWIYSPGNMISQFKSTWFSVRSRLGLLTFLAAIGVLFYTTAISTMVVPKLKLMPARMMTLEGEFYTSYGNMRYGMKKCPILFGKSDPDGKDDWACTSVEFCGQSYTDLLGFMQNWTDFQKSEPSHPFNKRPTPSSLLNGNRTMETAWIETTHRNVAAKFQEHGRIIDNVTMAMPHPGVFKAAELPVNGIPRIQDGFVGEVTVDAGVVSPSLNVMCVNMNKEELEPLVYLTWPNSMKDYKRVQELVVPADGFESQYPPWGEAGKQGSIPNKTVVDDIFKWGPKYGRMPPILSMFPPRLNMVANMSIKGSDGVYILIKSPDVADYTLCEARSWLSTVCSTKLFVSGTGGTYLRAVCEESADETAYHRTELASKEIPTPDLDWTWVAKNWSTSMDVNGGTRRDDGSNARILAQLILKEPKIEPTLPTIAEALAAYLASTVVMSAIDSPFHYGWNYPYKILDEPASQKFSARVGTRQYAAGHTEDWQNVWYVVLFIVPLLSLCCFAYLLLNGGVMTDFTERQTLFALALNSPPSVQLHGSCGSGPTGRDLFVPWRVSYEPGFQHYYFEEANNKPWRGKYSKQHLHVAGPGEDYIGANYNRLSASRLRL